MGAQTQWRNYKTPKPEADLNTMKKRKTPKKWRRFAKKRPKYNGELRNMHIARKLTLLASLFTVLTE